MIGRGFLNDQGGMTLIDVMAAGAILLLASLMAARGVLFAGKLMERSVELEICDQNAKSAAERGVNPDRSERCDLKIGGETVTVIVEDYGCTQGDTHTVFKTIRKMEEDQ